MPRIRGKWLNGIDGKASAIHGQGQKYRVLADGTVLTKTDYQFVGYIYEQDQIDVAWGCRGISVDKFVDHYFKTHADTA